MVLEVLLNPRSARKRPYLMLFYSIALSSTAIWLSYFTFPSSASTLSLAYITIGLMPLIHVLLVTEEKEDTMPEYEKSSFLERHGDMLKLYAYFFIGIVVSYSFWYVVMPENARPLVFMEQEATLDRIDVLRAELTGKAIVGSLGECGKNFACVFQTIMVNNSLVLILAIVFSFIYGAGAIFLISWNASVIAALIGRDALNLLTGYAGLGSAGLVAAYAHAHYNALGLLLHGSLEIAGYFIGAIAGGVIGVMVMKRRRKPMEAERVSRDVAVMVAVAFACLLIGALIEAFLIVNS